MSGHSKWHNIQKTKGAADAKRAQAFTKIAREMIVAVKEGGSGDPRANSRLAAVIAKAKAANMPNDNIKRTIDKALGSGNTDNYENGIYTERSESKIVQEDQFKKHKGYQGTRYCRRPQTYKPVKKCVTFLNCRRCIHIMQYFFSFSFQKLTLYGCILGTKNKQCSFIVGIFRFCYLYYCSVDTFYQEKSAPC